MAKFKVGDRVKLAKDHDMARWGRLDGETGVVTEKSTAPFVRWDRDGAVWAATEDEIELVTPALRLTPGKFYRTASGKVTGRVTKGDTTFEAIVDGKLRLFDRAGGAVGNGEDIVEEWVPKVGERVNVTYGHGWDGEGLVERLDSYGFVNVMLETGGRSGYIGGFAPSELEPAATPLRIEAGRYYKTRDGRKVGPIKAVNYVWPFQGGATGESMAYYNADGSCPYIPEDDLVALWEEPTVAVAASNDNAAPAKPAKSKFKVGDRLRLKENFFGVAAVGATAKVGPKGMYDTFVDVIWDKNGLANGQLDGGYYPQYFELVSRPSAIVCLIENGQTKPATVPHVHASEEAASKEAKRLAGVHKGQEFGVFVLTSTSQEAAPTYKHEWQRLAAKGEKIAAIKELRSVTGLGLKAAKDAVEYWLANDEQYARLVA